jgi:hypothetical protein
MYLSADDVPEQSLAETTNKIVQQGVEQTSI